MVDGTRGGSNDGTLPLIATDDAGAAGAVQIVKLALSADGSATPITADADGLLVNLGANNDVTVTGTVSVTEPVSVDDNGASLTVDGVVTIGGANVGAFGDIIAAAPTPILQLDFVYGINTQTGVTTVSTTGVVDTLTARLRVQSGTGAAGSGIYASKRPAKYRPGQGIVARFTTIFTTGVASSTQIVGMGNVDDGYFVGFLGANFGLLHRIRGSDTWVAQTAWNGDKLAGAGATAFTLDATKGNVWQVIYPYLGFGAIRLYCLDVSGAWLLAHTIRYPNSTTATQLGNPNLPFYAQSVNTGATTNQILYVGSVGVFLTGARSFIGSPKWTQTSSKTTVTTEQVGLNLRNATTYNGIPNRSLIRLHSIGIASTANNGVATVRLKFGATVAGSPSWATISGTTADAGVTITAGNSVASTDTAGTSTGGTTQHTAVVGSPGSQVIDLTPFDLFLAPGEDLTITVASTNSTTVAVALNWSEDI